MGKDVVFVSDSDYVVHVCRGEVANIPIERHPGDDKLYGVCKRCGTLFVYRSKEDIEKIREEEYLKANIDKVFPF